MEYLTQGAACHFQGGIMDYGNNTEGLKLGQDRATETLY